MSFTEQQVQELSAPLSSKHVKEREQAGRKLSYVESWHAIAEANRIFGYGDWTSETVDLRCVSEAPRKIGKQQRDGHAVSYIAKVRVTVGEIVREGVGAGHGIDVDLGLAHESAAKEAESDARKRALMTFGNPFGLALYDKEQRNVVDEPQAAPEPKSSWRAILAPAASLTARDALIEALRTARDEASLQQWGSEHAAEVARLQPGDATAVREAFGSKLRELRSATDLLAAG